MAIDIWMVFFIFSVFLALLLFTSTYWLKIQLERRAKRLRELRQRKKSKENDENEQPLPEDEDEDYLEQHYLIDRYHRMYKQLIHFTERKAFILFSTTFLLFVVLYWMLLMKLSQYWDWEPSDVFNNLGEGDSDKYSYFSSKEGESTDWIVDEATDMINLKTEEFRKLNGEMLGSRRMI